MKKINDMTKEELWDEIQILIDSTRFCESDKELFKEIIQFWSIK